MESQHESAMDTESEMSEGGEDGEFGDAGEVVVISGSFRMPSTRGS